MIKPNPMMTTVHDDDDDDPYVDGDGNFLAAGDVCD